MSRRAGVNVPLFSLPEHERAGASASFRTSRPFRDGCSAAASTELMVLPLGTMPDGETSPYSATSTLAIDPIYISLDDVIDFTRAGGIDALSEEARSALASARESPTIRHREVRRAKHEALAIAFNHFLTDEWEQLTPRAAVLAAYVARERWWLDDYALFQALSRVDAGTFVADLAAALASREPRALDEARRQLASDVLEQQYRQWIAETQWQDARSHAQRPGRARARRPAVRGAR